MPEVQAPLADRIGRALVPMVEMFKALPPQAGDDCQVQVVILRRDLRLAHEAGTAIVHEAKLTEAGSILAPEDHAYLKSILGVDTDRSPEVTDELKRRFGLED